MFLLFQGGIFRFQPFVSRGVSNLGPRGFSTCVSPLRQLPCSPPSRPADRRSSLRWTRWIRGVDHVGLMGSQGGGLVELHPWNLTTNPRMEKEKHRPKAPIFGFHVCFRGWNFEATYLRKGMGWSENLKGCYQLFVCFFGLFFKGERW